MAAAAKASWGMHIWVCDLAPSLSHVFMAAGGECCLGCDVEIAY